MIFLKWYSIVLVAINTCLILWDMPDYQTRNKRISALIVFILYSILLFYLIKS